MTAVFMPRTLEELLEIKHKEPGLSVFAGGTDLVPAMRRGRKKPSALACLDRLDAIRDITDSGDAVSVGAGVTHAALLDHPLIREAFPVLTQALLTLGSPHIRNMGTIGGNIVTASPAGDTLPPLMVLGARVELAEGNQRTEMPLSEFITGPGVIRLAPDQILWRVIIPKAPGFTGHFFEKVGLRKALSIAVVSMAALASFDASGAVRDIRMAWGSVGPTVMTSFGAEAILRGCRLDTASLAAAAEAVRKDISPISDVRAGADYRRMVAGNLLHRLETAFKNQTGNGRS